MRLKLPTCPEDHYILVIWQHYGGTPFYALVPIHKLSYAYRSCIKRAHGKFITDKKMPDDALIVRDAFFSELDNLAWLKPYRVLSSDVVGLDEDIKVKSVCYTGQVP